MASEEQAQPQRNAVPAPVDGVAAAVDANPPPPIPAGLAGIWSKIKRHKVVEWTLAYLAFGYATLHGVEMLREAFAWPEIAARLTVLVLLLGLPLAITLAWYHGHRARQRISGPELVIVTLLLVLAGSALWFFSTTGARPRDVVSASVTPAVQSPAGPEAFSLPLHSVAVLPFTNLSGDPDYFSDGMSEEIINALAQIDSLHVIARTSSFSFRGQNVDIETIGRKLHAGAILEGSVRRVGNKVRITAQLINARDGIHIWSQDYDRELTDALALQTEIATVVAQQLQAKLLGDEAAKIEEGGTHNPTAYDAYLRGLQILNNAKNEQDYRRVIEAADQAIAADPQYADAYTLKARVLIHLTLYSGQHEDLSAALEAGRHAVMLAPNQGEAHAVLGTAMGLALDFSVASREINRAISLSPGNAVVQDSYAKSEFSNGHHENALIALRRAVELDPQNSDYRERLGYTLYAARRPGDALIALRDAEALNPGSHAVGYDLVRVYLEEGRFDLMAQFCEKADSPLDADSRHVCLACAYHGLGKAKEAQEQLEKLKALNGDSDTFGYATVYAQFGQTRDAIDSLLKAERLRNPALVLIQIEPMLDPIRNEPAFKALVRRLNFPP